MGEGGGSLSSFLRKKMADVLSLLSLSSLLSRGKGWWKWEKQMNAVFSLSLSLSLSAEEKWEEPLPHHLSLWPFPFGEGGGPAQKIRGVAPVDTSLMKLTGFSAEREREKEERALRYPLFCPPALLCLVFKMEGMVCVWLSLLQRSFFSFILFPQVTR